MLRILLAGIFVAGWCAASQAEDTTSSSGQVFVRVGLTGVIWEPQAKLSVAGQPLDNGGITASSNITASFEGGVYVLPNVSVSVSGGLPPQTSLNGTGVLAPAGRLGEVRYGFAVALASYHFAGLGSFQPWIGIGPMLAVIFGTTDAAVQNLKVNTSLGMAIQIGGEYVFDRHWSAYASASQNFLQTSASGQIGSLPISAKATLNPLVLQSGVGYRF
jgi:outer membrane protein